MVGDKGYSGEKIRTYLRGRSIGVVIVRQANEKRRGNFDREAYRQRNVVERLINRSSSFAA